MNRHAKSLALRIARAGGLLRACERITGDELRIICYHGIAVTDEHEFRPGVFITPALLESRLDWLIANKFNVLPLDEALAAMRAGALPPKPVVLTFDDGFYGTCRYAIPALRARGLPATIYVSSYYMLKGGLVFRLAVQYAFWKTTVPDPAGAAAGLPEFASSDWSGTDRDTVVRQIYEYGEQRLEEPGRRELLARLAEALRVDYRQMLDSRGLGLMTPDEVREAAEQGIDIQLHTHRHRFPADVALAAREVDDNRRYLQPLVTRPLNHLCYPSSEYHERAFPMLSTRGIASGMTCNRGMNTRATPPYLMNRFVDRQELDAIEFEAEMRGAAEILRRIFRRQRKPVETVSLSPRTPRRFREASR